MSIDCVVKLERCVSNAVAGEVADVASADAIVFRTSKIPIGVPPRLWNRAVVGPVANTLSNPGKRVRATVLDCSYIIAGGHSHAPQVLLDAIEVLHAGSLIIDDIEDGSLFRRERPALHRSIGMPLAINTGNWMYFYAMQQLANLPLCAVTQNAILLKTASVVRECHEGQALDLSVQIAELQSFEVLSIVSAISRMKTGGLLSLAAWLGGVAAESPSELLGTLEEFGMQVGIGLQMLNDLNALKECEGAFTNCDDLRNGRATWAWAWLSELVPAKQFHAIAANSGIEPSESTFPAIAIDLGQRVRETGLAAVHETIWNAFGRLHTAVGSSSALSRLEEMLNRLEQKYA